MLSGHSIVSVVRNLCIICSSVEAVCLWIGEKHVILSAFVTSESHAYDYVVSQDAGAARNTQHEVRGHKHRLRVDTVLPVAIQFPHFELQ